MITTEQFEAARKVVAAYEDQQYAVDLEQVQREFPIGTEAESRNGWTSGTIYGYGRFGCEVTLKVRNEYGSGHFLSKYAKINRKTYETVSRKSNLQPLRQGRRI